MNAIHLDDLIWEQVTGPKVSTEVIGIYTLDEQDGGEWLKLPKNWQLTWDGNGIFTLTKGVD